MQVTSVTRRRVVNGPWRRVGPYISAILSSIESGDLAGTTVATLSVANSDDVSFAWSLLIDANGDFEINQTTGVVTLAVSAFAGVYPITIQAIGSPSGELVSRALIIVVTGDEIVATGSIAPFVFALDANPLMEFEL